MFFASVFLPFGKMYFKINYRIYYLFFSKLFEKLTILFKKYFLIFFLKMECFANLAINTCDLC